MIRTDAGGIHSLHTGLQNLHPRPAQTTDYRTTDGRTKTGVTDPRLLCQCFTQRCRSLTVELLATQNEAWLSDIPRRLLSRGRRYPHSVEFSGVFSHDRMAIRRAHNSERQQVLTHGISPVIRNEVETCVSKKQQRPEVPGPGQRSGFGAAPATPAMFVAPDQASAPVRPPATAE